MKKSMVILGGITAMAMATTPAFAAKKVSSKTAPKTTSATQAKAKKKTVLASTSPSSAASSSTASAKSVAPKLIDKVTASYSTIFEGPSMIDPLASTTPNEKLGETRGGSAIRVLHYVGAAYKFDNGMNLGPVLRFNTSAASGRKFDLVDPYLRLNLGKVIQSGNFSLGGDVRYGAPVSERSRGEGKIGYLRSTQAWGLSIPQSRFSLSLTTIEIASAYSTSSAGKTVFYLYAGPQVDYQVVPTLSAFALFNMEAAKNGGEDKLLSLNNLGTSIDSGVSWDITPMINVSPYLNLKTNSGIKAQTTSLNASFSWRLL